MNPDTRRIDEYTLVRTLGIGKSSIVYSVFLQDANQIFALKRYFSVVDFLNEKRVYDLMPPNPHILTPLHMNPSSENPYSVFEEAEFGDLQRLL